MKKGTLLLGLAVGLGVVAAAGRAIYLDLPWFRRTPPPAPAPLAAAPATAGPSAAPCTLQAWHRALGGEVLVFTRGTDTGRPLAGVEVRITDGNGESLRSGRADDRGVYRGTLPAGAAGIHVRSQAHSLVFAVAPEGASVFPPPRPMLADRSLLRPGDRLRVCIRLTPDLAGAVPVATLRFEPAEAAVEPVPFLPVAAGGPASPSAWGVFEALVPGDVRPGTAVVACGEDRLGIPLLPRFGLPADDDGAGGSPDTPPDPPGDGLSIESREGRWHARSSEEMTAILVFATAGDRLLAHEAAVVDGNEASVALPRGDGADRVTAVAATAGGFLEAAAAVPGAPAPGVAAAPAGPPDADPVLAGFLAGRPSLDLPVAKGPSWVHEGDVVAGAAPPPPALPGFLSTPAFASAPAFTETGLFPEGRPPPGTEIRWKPRPAGARGAVRVRSDRAIVLEAALSPDGGLLRAGDLGEGVVVVEGPEGLEALDFTWDRRGPIPGEPPRRGLHLSLDRSLPESGARGEVVEVRLVVRSDAPGRVEVLCPLPRGAEPAEDGWAIRSRAPPGTRVSFPDGAVAFSLPSFEGGEATLSFRARLAWPGRYAAPAASAIGLGLGGEAGSIDVAWTAAGTLVVE